MVPIQTTLGFVFIGSAAIAAGIFGMRLPAGDHTVVFTFEPSGWRLGLAIAGLALLLLAILGFLAWWGFRRQRDLAV